MKILLLEDDLALADIIKEYLEDNDFEVQLVTDGEEALDKTYENNYDLYIFDVNVPLLRGFDLLKQLRKNDDRTPTIYITSLNDIEDISEGFESGADDYLKKPFELAELLLRIKNLQKRSFTQKRSSIIEISENTTFDLECELLYVDQKPISLAPKELRALKYFLQHPNHTVTFDQLYDVMWDYDEESSAVSLRAHMKNLRKKLGQDKIQNIRGVGYRYATMEPAE
ncbi:response regulator transcription factor [Sulfurovum mangrovi]|uniref:response regulator transcription factor n=1 Tax=Sulfurovum mangrovi TaxID=2893889 RepID=UPI001E3D42AD|nr:response regulator transcription factor [Sulfurovum mangrovi]UFH58181.1 response regulator transcription factor [Sulfurovum mangrovi]